MYKAVPKVFVIAETKQHSAGAMAYLAHIDATRQPALEDDFKTDAKTGGEWLIEVAGRSCYRSFKPQLNKNVNRVREGNMEYIGNIVKQKHGSVLEHATVSFAVCDVSRIFTHELVRHRAGVAISQESGRYVRIDNIGMFEPECFTKEWLLKNVVPFADMDAANAGGAEELAAHLEETFKADMQSMTLQSERFVEDWSSKFDLDNKKMPFDVKKQITSGLRRAVVGGLATSIVFTANHRAIRHMIAMRTAEGAEEEIRIVFHDIAVQMKRMYPAIYQDMTFNGPVDDEPTEPTDLTVTFLNDKV